MEKIKLIDKIARYDFEIIFGLLSGSGFFFLVTILYKIIPSFLPKLEEYSLIVYALLYLLIFIPILLIYTKKGWFRISFLISAIILFITQIYVKIFGTIF